MTTEDIVNITEKIKAELADHRARTGIGPHKLLKNTRHQRPPGLRANIVSNWIEGKNKTLRQSHLDYILKLWSALPDGADRIEITPQIKAELNQYRQITGVGSHAITTVYDDCPKGLSSGIIQYWLDGKIKTANRRHLESVISVWKAIDVKRKG